MAAADATLSESTPALIGIRTRSSAAASQRADRPSPSVPSSSASLPPDGWRLAGGRARPGWRGSRRPAEMGQVG